MIPFFSKITKTLPAILSIFLLTVTSVFAQESNTLTTYYPSPFGNYQTLNIDNDLTINQEDLTVGQSALIGSRLLLMNELEFHPYSMGCPTGRTSPGFNYIDGEVWWCPQTGASIDGTYAAYGPGPWSNGSAWWWYTHLLDPDLATTPTWRVGIGTDDPKTKFYLTTSTNSDNGSIYFTGDYGGAASYANTHIDEGGGTQTKFYWMGWRGALRSGTVTSAQWDAVAPFANVGAGSVAFGQDTIAGGAYDTALGIDTESRASSTTTSGYNFIMGDSNTIDAGDFNFVGGLRVNAMDPYFNFAYGEDILTSNYAIALGYGLDVQSNTAGSFWLGFGGVYPVAFGFGSGAMIDGVLYPAEVQADNALLFSAGSQADNFADGSIMFALGNVGASSYSGTTNTVSIVGANGFQVLVKAVTGAATDTTFYVNGDIFADAFVISTSNLRAKENIQPVKGVEGIEELQGVRFDWKKDGSSSMGVIAEEVNDVYPTLVGRDEQGDPISVQTANLVAPLIEAVKDQQEILEDQNRRIQDLQNKIELMKSRL